MRKSCDLDSPDSQCPPESQGVVTIMNADRRNDINHFASVIRDEYDIETPVTEQALVSLIDKLGGEVRTADDVGFEGRIYKKSTQEFIIEINSETYPKRKKFTLAHELGHLFLHMFFFKKER